MMRSAFRMGGSGDGGAVSLLALVSFLLLTTMPSVVSAKKLRFAMMSGGSSFFDPIHQGWEATCERLGVECVYQRPNLTWFREVSTDPEADKSSCVLYMRQFIAEGYDGIAAKCNVGNHSVFYEAQAAGIPVVTFAGPHSQPYEVYVGTDNRYLGTIMAKLLKQLRPQGGTYWYASNGPTSEQRAAGFRAEIEKDNTRKDRAHWHLADIPYTQFSDFEFPFTLGFNDTWRMSNMDFIAEHNPDAFIFMYQTPMRNADYTNFVDRHRHRNIIFIGTEGNDYQLQYMSRHYVHGLVGQLTWDMGVYAAENLYRIITEGNDYIPESKTLYTQLVNYNLVPHELPALDVDESLLGNITITGWVCFSIVAAFALFCTAWSLYYRQTVVVRASQPFFLVMTASGALIMAGAMIPLGFDDNGEPISDRRAIGICMSIPWLAFVGFTVTFSALFAKTWRVNQFFKSTSTHGRIQVSEKDVLIPFSILLIINIVILLTWTLVDPLKYVREYEDGLDIWSREIASNGYCRSDSSSAAYLVPLSLVNLALLATACYQSWQARDIVSEFAESKYIGLTVFSMAQGFLTGIPVVVVVRDIPEAYYLVLTLLLFVICMAVLLLIFIPKILMERKYSKLSLEEQKKAMLVGVRQSAGQIPPPKVNSGFEGTRSVQHFRAGGSTDPPNEEGRQEAAVPVGAPSLGLTETPLNDGSDPTSDSTPPSHSQGEQTIATTPSDPSTTPSDPSTKDVSSEAEQQADPSGNKDSSAETVPATPDSSDEMPALGAAVQKVDKEPVIVASYFEPEDEIAGLAGDDSEEDRPDAVDA